LKSGDLIIALPSIIGDPHFHRSVVHLVSYSIENTFGFILNKKLSYQLNDVVEGIDPPVPLYFGGPVEPDNLFFIHKLGSQIPNSLPVDATFYWSGDFDTVVKTLNENASLVKEFRFFLGYSGWDKNQLQNEIKTKAWHVKENNYARGLFEKADDSLWRDEMIGLGGHYIIWSNAPENPNSN